MNLSRPFIRRPVASILTAVAVVLLGMVCYRLLPVAPLPQVDFPTIRVFASLPGASPETMAASVATPLERALGSVAGVNTIISYSGQGSTNITLQLDLGRDINAAARDVQSAINAASGDLPSGMPRNPTYRKVNPSQAPIMALALSSPDLSQARLYDLATTILAQKISQVNGVGDVGVWGSSLPAIRVELNPNALAHEGVSLDDIRQAIAATNAIRPLGVVETRRRQWQVQDNSQLRRAAQYRSLIVRYNHGAPVRLGDIATVTDSVENRFSRGFHNTEPAVLIMVQREPGANIVATIDAIDAQLPQLRALLPADARLELAMDRSPGIRETLHEAKLTLLFSALLVILVVVGFLGSARAALIPTLAIPVSLIGTFAVMYVEGFSLNNLSLMALIVASGLVVDDAIVVLENVTRHMERGLSPLRAALRASGEVGFTLLAMSVSVATVFASILLMGGLVEQLFREFSLTLAAAVFISLAVSLTLTPSLCSRWLRAPRRPDPAKPPAARRRWQPAQWPAAALAVIRRGYARSLGWVLENPALVLIMFAGTLALDVTLFIRLPKGFLPVQDTGQLNAWIRGDDGFSFQIMQPKIDVYRKLLLSDPAVADVIGNTSGINNASLVVRLKPLAERGVSAEDVINRIRAKMPAIPGAYLYLGVSQDIWMPRISDGGSYDFTLLSDDLALLRKWAPRVTAAMRALPELTEVDGPSDGGAKQVTLTIDRETARRLGVDMRTVTSVLDNSFSQRPISTIYNDLNQYRVVMELAPRFTADPTVLNEVQVIGAGGKRIPLSAFTHYSYSLVKDRVRHWNQFASDDVGFSLAPGVTLEQASAAIDRAMARIMLPTQVQAKLAGTAQTFQQTLDREPLLLLGVLAAVYLVLGILYESLIHPLTILSVVPGGALGALLILRLTGTDFTLIALLGMFLLIGIVMKNAILMIDFALAAQRKEGRPPREAIFGAALLRLRPILMANLATLLGALPLILASGEGVEIRRPLGLVIVGGLIVSEVLALYTVPVMYLCFDRIRTWPRRRRSQTHAIEAEPVEAR